MSFSSDRDLLLLEPNVFRDVPFVAQQRLRGSDGVLSSVTLTSASSDFAAAQVDTGCVVLIGDVPHEVVARVDANTLTVSLPRAGSAEAAIPSSDGSALEIVVRTFAPQAALVHDALLRMVGIDVDDPAGDLTESAIVSTTVLRELEALATLERIYSAAFALTGDNTAVFQKAQEYRRRFHGACATSSVLIDLDGDGEPDVRRHLGVMRMRRI